MSGKYLKKDTMPKKGRKVTNNEKNASGKRGKGMKTLLIVLVVLVVLCATGFVLARVNGITTFSDVTKVFIKLFEGDTSEADDVMVQTAPTVPTDPTTDAEQEADVTDTQELPVRHEVVATQNVTTIMLVGRDHREDQENYLPDTMIMCTINRDTNTLTMTSILHDLYVPLPEYQDHAPGCDRINVCYDLGTAWTGSVKGGMEMLALCVEQNFGIRVDHTIEVDVATFEEVVDMMGGVDITMTQEEADYLNKDETRSEWSYYPDHTFSAGPQTLNGMDALAYSRIREIDSDFQRTNRQRTVMDSLLEKSKQMGLWDLHKMTTEIIPLVTTDMTDEEMTNYIWDFIPMLADLNVVSQKIPLDNDQLNGESSYTDKEVEGLGNVLEPDLVAHRKYLQENLGYADAEE